MQLSERSSKRIASLRFLLVFFVVCIHVYPYRYLPGAYTLSFAGRFVEALLCGEARLSDGAVPVFFIVAAYLQFGKDDPYPLLLKKKAKSLLVPYLAWIGLYLLACFVLQTVTHTNAISLNSTGDILSQWGLRDWIGALTGYGRPTGMPIVAPLWFVRDLMILVILSPVIRWLLRHSSGLLLLALAGIAYYCEMKLYAVFPVSLFFYCVGAFLGARKIDLFAAADRCGWAEALILYAVVFLAEFAGFQWPCLSYVPLAGVTAALVMLKLSALLIGPGPVPRVLGGLERYAFFVYCLHGPFVMAFLNRYWLKLFPVGGAWDVLNILLPALLCTALCLAAGILLDRLLPPVFHLLNGSRKRRA